MNLRGLYCMGKCNKAGIRIYPVLKYGSYYLEVEFNKSAEFLPREVIKKKMGTERYPTNTNAWSDKALELYEHFYHTKLMPKSEAA